MVQGIWNPIASLSECRRYPSSATFTFANQDILFISGGYSDPTLDSVESFNGTTWDQDKFTNLPQPTQIHCTVKINETMLFIVGGTGDENYSGALEITWFFHVVDNVWIPGPDLIVPRLLHSCGILSWLNPITDQIENVVVVAGGGDNSSVPLTSVELLHLENFQDLDLYWEEGPSLPKTVLGATMVEFENSVILIGGEGEVDGFHLYQLNSPGGPWLEMKQTLKEARSRHVSFLVPDDLVNCH